jgi:hypothetical protein
MAQRLTERELADILAADDRWLTRRDTLNEDAEALLATLVVRYEQAFHGWFGSEGEPSSRTGARRLILRVKSKLEI